MTAISAVGGQCCAFAVAVLRAGRQPQNLRLSALLQLCSKPSTFSSAEEATFLHLQSEAHLLRRCQGSVYVQSAQHGGGDVTVVSGPYQAETRELTQLTEMG